jgi:hypothetical protein
MAKRPTFITTDDISKCATAPSLSERVMKTSARIATASAVAFSGRDSAKKHPGAPSRWGLRLHG